MYDVIIVGARVAGASTALLLARRGVKVLCVDKARFPSDTLSTHQIQVTGVARLKRWGLLDAIVAAGTPATRELRFDTGEMVLEGRFPAYQEADALYGPRRTIIDEILVKAARQSGAELREDVLIERISFTDRGAAEVSGRLPSGQACVETCALVVGADGKSSLVAKAAGAATTHETPPRSAAYYGYWEDLRLPCAEMYERPGRAIGVWPTSDGLTVIFMALPIAEFPAFREDVPTNFFKTLDLCGDLGDRVRAARQVGRFSGSANLPNRVRKPYGPGWALVGDAGFVMDPITAQGMSQAVRDAELLTHAIVAGSDNQRELQRAMRGYETERNRQGLPMYRLTVEQAALGPRPRELDELYRALQGNRAETDKFFGLISGAVPVKEYLSPPHLLRLLGAAGIARIAAGKVSALAGRLVPRFRSS
jgi:2-polyprenyl-6-methoxyphenol hydroxylase-like FAD-dependent oxidoreductase